VSSQLDDYSYRLDRQSEKLRSLQLENENNLAKCKRYYSDARRNIFFSNSFETFTLMHLVIVLNFVHREAREPTAVKCGPDEEIDQTTNVVSGLHANSHACLFR
jgi:hypothetical protein